MIFSSVAFRQFQILADQLAGNQEFSKPVYQQLSSAAADLARTQPSLTPQVDLFMQNYALRLLREEPLPPARIAQGSETIPRLSAHEIEAREALRQQAIENYRANSRRRFVETVLYDVAAGGHSLKAMSLADPREETIQEAKISLDERKRWLVESLRNADEQMKTVDALIRELVKTGHADDLRDALKDFLPGLNRILKDLKKTLPQVLSSVRSFASQSGASQAQANVWDKCAMKIRRSQELVGQIFNLFNKLQFFLQDYNDPQVSYFDLRNIFDRDLIRCILNISDPTVRSGNLRYEVGHRPFMMGGIEGRVLWILVELMFDAKKALKKFKEDDPRKYRFALEMRPVSIHSGKGFAKKAVPVKSPVPDGDFVEIKFSHNGPAMSEETLFQEELAFALGLVEEMGGFMAWNPFKIRGASSYVYLPQAFGQLIDG
jgi:hypothetical protein